MKRGCCGCYFLALEVAACVCVWWWWWCGWVWVGGRVVAVGTTAVRSLETAAANGALAPFEGETRLFIYPGYRFRVVEAMVTNFHLSESTLLMLVFRPAGIFGKRTAF